MNDFAEPLWHNPEQDAFFDRVEALVSRKDRDPVSLNRYPTELPLAEARVVLDYFRGAGATAASAVEAGWYVSGYALSLAPIGPPLMTGTGEDAEQQCKAALESLVSQGESGHRTVQAGGLWLTVLAQLLPILLDLIRKRGEAV
jgi:hypothetical protein